MSDIAASERRLSAALDRMDQLLDSNHVSRAEGGTALADQGDSAEIADLRAVNAELQARIRELEDKAHGSADPDSGMDDRLTEAGEQAARLAAANDELAVANRALLDSLAGQGDVDAVTTIRQALEAEIEALRAARAAEISNLGDIIMELERLLPEGSELKPARSASDDPSGEGNEPAARDRQGVFSAVYGEASDGPEDAELEDK